MTAILHTGPQTEPVSMTRAKTHLRVENTADDLLISALITTARVYVETTTRRQLIRQRWRIVYDSIARGETICLDLAPLIEVNAVRVYNGNGQAHTLSESEYVVDLLSAPARLRLNVGSAAQASRPFNGFEIDAWAGYGADADSVPAPLRQAILQLVAHWYEHRSVVTSGMSAVAEPDGVAALMEPYRMVTV